MTDSVVTETAPTPDVALATRLRHAGGAMAGGLGACAYYALDRTQAALRHGPPNPLTMTASHRIDYFWRIAIAAFLGTLVYGVWIQATRGREERAFATLTRFLIPVVLFCTVLAALFP